MTHEKNKRLLLSLASFLSGRFPRGRTVPLVGTPHSPYRDPVSHSHIHIHTHTHTHTQMPAQVTVLIQVLEKDVTNMSIVQIHGTGPLQQTVRTTIQLRILLLLLQDTTLSFGQIHCYQQPKGELLLLFPRVRLTGPTFVGTPSLSPSLPGAFLLPQPAT